MVRSLVLGDLKIAFLEKINLEYRNWSEADNETLHIKINGVKHENGHESMAKTRDQHGFIKTSMFQTVWALNLKPKYHDKILTKISRVRQEYTPAQYC